INLERLNINVEVLIDMDLLLSLLVTILCLVETSQLFLKRRRNDIRMNESHVNGKFLATSSISLTQQTVESCKVLLVLLQLFAVLSEETKAADIAEAIEVVVSECTEHSL
ncbi:hypothetical protein PMAYCL1PPCAC_08318, partial [Pristionchus mayeri]